MTATEELRRLLSERGVEWENGVPYGANAVTRFKVNDVWLRYVDYGDYQWLDYHENEPLTPEQAIAATLGPGTCHLEINTSMTAVVCDRCNYPMPRGTVLTEVHFCPNCGRKVADS